MIKSPIIIVLLLAAFSFVGAGFFWLIGGTVAEVTGKTGIMGLTFKAGGGLAGFLIVFVFLFYAFQKLAGRARYLKVALIGNPDDFVRAGNTYKGRYTILNSKRDTRQKKDFIARWEAGSLTLDVPNVGQEDLIQIIVSNQHGDKWESEYFSAFSPRTEMKKA